jgi:hypothetical protein
VSSGGVSTAAERLERAPVETEAGADPASFVRGIGWRHMAIAACAAAGLLLAASSFRMARENLHLDGARALLWLALALIYAPPLGLVLRRGRSRTERIGALLICGVSLYVVKVLYDPTRLGFPDELIHATNAGRIIESGGLFNGNSISPVSARFPGLSAIAASVADILNIGVVPSGLIVIGVARVLLTLGLFLLFEQVARGDSRLAAVATLLFCANPNYLYWSSQFSYESLSLPLFVLVLFCALRRWEAVQANRGQWTLAALPAVTLIAVTHHVTGIALALALWVLVAVARRRGTPAAGPLVLALSTTLLVAGWLAFMAPDTVTYLGDIFRRAGDSVTSAFTSSGTTRKPFEGNGGAAAPIDDKLLAVLSAVLAVGASVAGARLVWRRGIRSPLEPMLVLAALASVIVYGARVFPDAWETANRASEYVFIGVSLMAAVVAVDLVDRGRPLLVALTVLAALCAVAGSSVSGWPATAQLPRPFHVQTFGTTVSPQGAAVARWSASVDPGATYVANDAAGRLLMVRGVRHVLSSRAPGVPELLKDPTLPTWQQQFLRDEKVDRVILDERRFTNGNVIGYFFPRPGEALARYPAGVRTKFEHLPRVSRTYDSGDVVVYDLRDWRGDAR